MADPWKRERTEQDRRHLARMGGKVTAAARQRMQRTAREQLADALAASRAPVDLPDPDDGEDDASSQPGVLR